ncbi:hypothetical protein GCM10027089_04790 [Nocardia thraciensis]
MQRNIGMGILAGAIVAGSMIGAGPAAASGLPLESADTASAPSSRPVHSTGVAGLFEALGSYSTFSTCLNPAPSNTAC